MTKKIRSKKNNLFNYFACDHKDLSKDYLKSCNNFFKPLVCVKRQSYIAWQLFSNMKF